MTDKQINRTKAKITKIKKALAAEKKHWGGFYHDGGGLRYAQPQLYIQIQDFTGALRYFNWFEKNFPEDPGTAAFLFEYALTLFKTNRIERAKKKILELIDENKYLLPYYLDRDSFKDIDPNSDWLLESVVNYFHYKKEDSMLTDFSIWLTDFLETENLLDLKKNN
ncbi:hypothetical protein DFQ11_102654 [Winogradskyella epiphytica]|uniref:Tetratricopeptide repeat protein n=1 Tax=Winogradskyella epiphytica TaxID=262005 RepID=A0A2V4XGV8_9FLAO|nr:tetratricopeptide repeat protein [Winogradskyella epiphytica]PYE82074.1 hypothetical protein DFQ11_102654 [Winogradskyella epiphytica]GGW60692.1 hypothetical protein GCM10008085_10210 [Winogradskyella epiphytica]